MHDTDHPAIKLFGKEIPLPPPSAGALSGVSEDEVASSPAMNPNNREEEDEVEKESTKLQAWGKTAKPKTPSVDEETVKSKASSTDQERAESCDSQEKPLKKPDKILPCPRCNSMNTKFCYYNNYNVNQPRYFCKSCQRYWTAGGTMRNVPVGAGRRKNKSSNSHYRHITISEEVLQAAYAVDAPNGTHLPDEKDNGTVLNFGVDIPVCDSMASILNRMGRNRNGIHGLRRNMVSNSCRSSGNCDDCSSESTVSISGSADEGNGNYCPEQPMDSVNECSPPQLLGLAGVPWPCYQWNPAFLSQPLCPSGIAMPIYPTTFWNCGLHTTFDVPLSSPSYQKTTNSSGPDLPTLGKHPREDEVQGQDDPVKDECSKQRSDNCVLAPKTLRIGDPTEAAKSTIWTTLGIKNDQLCKERLYKGLSKCEEKNHVPQAVPVLCANPAALSRSLHFRESY